MSEQIRHNYPEDCHKALAETAIPEKYRGEPEDLAVVAVWLASPLARYIIRAIILLDGGLRRHSF
jgi:3-oxoacyl-[acyl-carrier protein] reductase